MARHFFAVIVFVAACWALGCSGAKEPGPAAQPAPEPAPPAVPAVQRVTEARAETPAGPVTAPNIWLTAEDARKDCDANLAAAQKIRDEIHGIQAERDLDNTLRPLNLIYVHLDRVGNTSEFMSNVSPKEEVRKAAESCLQRVMKLASELQLDRKIYDALAAVKPDGLDPKARRFLEHQLRDYKRGGVDRDEATRKELAEIQQEMVKAAQDYSRTLRDSRLFVEFDEEELEGLPKEFIEAHKSGEDGKVKISTDYPDYFPAVKYAKKEEVRKALTLKFLTRAYPDNEAYLKELLALRHRYAALLNHKSWADYNAGDKMMKTAKDIAGFIDKIAKLVRPKMKRDLRQLLKRKKKDVPGATRVRMWDSSYYVDKLQTEKYGVDAQQVRQYFEYARVEKGILDLVQELFAIEFKAVEGAPVWHKSVTAYDVLDQGKLIGRFYLDMHPRPNKLSHVATFPLYKGVVGVQLPAGALVCNFPEPSDKGPALMEHSDVITLLHELGHILHHILGGQQEWVTQSGVATELDFIETPTQLLQEWGSHPDALKRFALHHKTKEPIPQELVEKIRASEKLGKGAWIMRQMYLTALSFHYHNGDPAGIDLLKTMKKLQNKYSPYPYEKGTYYFANFWHLDGYSSAYYTYMWSLALAKDLFTKFEAGGIMDPAVSLEFRKKILEPGGSVDAADMMRDFLGREYSFDAFKNWLE